MRNNDLLTAMEAFSTAMNVCGVTNVQNKINSYGQHQKPRKVEAISKSSASKSYMESSVDGNGTHFEAYV